MNLFRCLPPALFVTPAARAGSPPPGPPGTALGDFPFLASPWFWLAAAAALVVLGCAWATWAYVYSLKWRMFGAALDYLECDDRDYRPRRGRKRRP